MQWTGGVREAATTGQPARAAGAAPSSHASHTSHASPTPLVAAHQAPALEVPPMLLGPDDAGGREFWDHLLLAVSAYREERDGGERDGGETRQPVLAASGMAGGADLKNLSTLSTLSTLSLPLLERRWQVSVSSEVSRQVVRVLFGRSCASHLSGAGPGVDTERSVASMVLEALLKCPVDVRGAVASRVVLAGGGVMLAGFQELLMQECALLARIVPRYQLGDSAGRSVGHPRLPIHPCRLKNVFAKRNTQKPLLDRLLCDGDAPHELPELRYRRTVHMCYCSCGASPSHGTHALPVLRDHAHHVRHVRVH